MEIILLSGGSGKRLWPLSNDTRSKQFLKLLESPNGEKESMVQRVVRQLRETGIGDRLTVATSLTQRDEIINQLGENIPVVTEPERRDTFPAIALGAAFLKQEKHCSDDEVVVVMPCDPYTEAGYFETIAKIADAVKDNAAELVLMGIKRIRRQNMAISFLRKPTAEKPHAELIRSRRNLMCPLPRN